MAAGPLAGIKVLDFTQYQNGPTATRRLCDYGATVIKVEVPNIGDPMRKLVQLKDGYDLLFEIFNRGKRSVTIDLRKPEARPVIERLVQWADVLAENFRSGTMAGWGYGYEDVKNINPKIIYGSSSGFGSLGRLSHLGCFDMTAQAYAGLMSAQGGGPSHEPMVVEHCAADEVTGMTFAFAILAALVSRARTGEGQYLETSQLGALCEYQSNGAGLPTALKNGRTRDDGLPPFKFSPTQTYFIDSEGKWFVVCWIVQKFWEKMCQVCERLDLITDARTRGLSERAKNVQFMKEELQKTFATNTRAHWIAALQAVQIVCGPVNSYMDMIEEPHFWDNHYFAEVSHPHLPELGKIMVPGKAITFHGTPAGPVTTGELLGESTDAILQEIGFGDEIESLKRAGVLQSSVGTTFRDRKAYPAPPKSKL